MLVCEECGSDMVHSEGKFDSNTFEIIEHELDYCEDCRCETNLIDIADFDGDKEETRYGRLGS